MGKGLSSPMLLLLSLLLMLVTALMTSAAGDPVHGAIALVEVNYGETETYQASAVEVSPDGLSVYLGAAGGDITVYRRVSNPGRLVLIQHIADDDFGLPSGLFGIEDIVISPDGNHLYTCASIDHVLIVFNRNPVTGVLTYQAHVKDDSSGGTIDGLAGCRSLAITPNGKYVFAAGAEDDAIVRFSRDSITGLLTKLSPTVFDDTGLVTEIGGVFGLASSTDGRHLYAAANDDDAVTSFAINDTTGTLTYVNDVTDTDPGVNGLWAARSVAVSPDGSHVYVTSWFDDAVVTFARNNTTGALIFVEADLDSTWLDAARHVVVSPDGSHVYACSYAGDSVVVFSRDMVTGRLTFIQHLTDNTLQADGLNGAQQLSITPDGSTLYAASYSEGAMAILSVNSETGRLTFLHIEEALSGTYGPVGVAVSPDGKNVYIANNDSNSLTAVTRDSVSGKLRQLARYRDNVDGMNGLGGARAVAVSPDGKHVYVAGNTDAGVAIFSRNAEYGTLIYTGVVLNSDSGVGGLAGIQSLTVCPTGTYVYTVSSGDDADPDTDSLVAFNRNPDTGMLTMAQHLRDGVGGVDGLDDAYHVAVSADGGHVYVAGYGDHALTHFKWTMPMGLAPVTTFFDGATTDGLAGANYVVLSPDGSSLYVASRIDDAVVKFIRGVSNGLLSYHSVVRDGVGGVDGLNGARAMAINKSGTYLYVASQHDHALAVFSREHYGNLTYITALKDTDFEMDGLRTANGIALSPTFNHIYVTSYDDDAVSVFAHTWGLYVPFVVRE